MVIEKHPTGFHFRPLVLAIRPVARNNRSVSIAGSKLPQFTLRRELLLGRFVMIAFIAILLVRELSSVSVLTAPALTAVLVCTAVLTVTWALYWAFVASGPGYWAAGTAVALTVSSASILVHVNHIGVFPFYYAIVVAGTAFKWYISGPLVAIATGIMMAVWWPEGQTDANALQVVAIGMLLGGAAITVRRFIGTQVELEVTRDGLRQFAALEARMQLARDLHDRLGQELTTSIMQAELLSMDLDAGAIEDARKRSAMVLSSSRETLHLMRELVAEVREPDLRSEVSVAEQVLTSSGINCTIALDMATLPISADHALGWVVREGVTNVLRHSGASSCRIMVAADSDSVVLRVEDDGRGMGDGDGGMGLVHMRERLAAVGGSLSIADGPGGGCTLIAVVPVTS